MKIATLLTALYEQPDGTAPSDALTLTDLRWCLTFPAPVRVAATLTAAKHSRAVAVR